MIHATAIGVSAVPNDVIQSGRSNPPSLLAWGIIKLIENGDPPGRVNGATCAADEGAGVVEGTDVASDEGFIGGSGLVTADGSTGLGTNHGLKLDDGWSS
ncbi:hypothetical protein ACFVT6_19750 [Streptomyces sp. NPDC058049]|uniref:hypothetical protein n=1 Tax=Streptomyces sp. NPDC058049 TaxID=3346314 RepID=UPI0036EA37FD